MLELVVLLALVAWAGLLLAPWQPWRNRERLELDSVSANGSSADLSDLSILIPARNEAGCIGRTLAALRPVLCAGADLIVVDDASDDGTAGIVRDFARQNPDARVRLLRGVAADEGWSGKLWALEQGFREVCTPLTLLLDADIEIEPGIVRALVAKVERKQLAFASLMATLPVATPIERLLMPPFVYFFRLLYPFALANDPRFPIAAAAGGCVLVRSCWLRKLDAFARIRGRLIDDCALAKLIKEAGGRGWIGLSSGVRSHRDSTSLGSIAEMIARNAFTQLRHSLGLLLLCTAVMLVVFAGPPLGLVFGDESSRLASWAALAAMSVSYLPMVVFYRGAPAWALTLPVAGLFYLLMTWLSAVRYWRGQQSRWKGRVYETGFGT